MSLSAAERVRRFYSCFATDDQVLITIMADPDSIGSAMAVKRLLWRKVAGVTISNINAIKRPDNIALISRLSVKLEPMAGLACKRFNRFVLVDSQPGHHEAFGRLPWDIVIDHHPVETELKAPFVDVRPRYGATATIMTEYIRAARIKLSARLATALYYAIKTDTSNFERPALVEDVRAFQFLFHYANVQLARKIEQSDLTYGFLKYFSRALEGKRIRKDRIFVHLGTVANPDICVIIADFFMRIDKVNWSFVSGVYGKKLIIIFRSVGLRLNAGKLAQKSFGQLGSAGGHKSMARAEIALDRLQGIVEVQNGNKLLRWIIGRIEKRTLRT
jgi:nanoRNase/pAp phosphatase (c-di-AMP/oligoRNAs hydrolase)